MSPYQLIKESIFNAQFQLRKGLIHEDVEIECEGKVVAIVSRLCHKEATNIHVHYTHYYQDVAGGAEF